MTHHPTPDRAAKRMLIAKFYGRRAFGWSEDEPNGATGYMLRQEAADFADDLIDAFGDAGWDLVQREATRS